MSETLILGVLGGLSLVNLVGLGMIFTINYRLGRINGTIARHDKVYKACPFCPDKEV